MVVTMMLMIVQMMLLVVEVELVIDMGVVVVVIIVVIAKVIDQERSDIACRTERSLVLRHAEKLAQARLEYDLAARFALAVQSVFEVLHFHDVGHFRFWFSG